MSEECLQDRQWWLTPVSQQLQRLTQEDCCESEASLATKCNALLQKAINEENNLIHN